MKTDSTAIHSLLPPDAVQIISVAFAHGDPDNGYELAAVNLTPAYAAKALQRIAQLNALAASDPELLSLNFEDGLPEYIDYRPELEDWKQEILGNDVLTVLRDEERRELWEGDNAQDQSVRALDRCELIVTRTDMRFRAYFKHVHGFIYTAEIPVAMLEAIAAAADKLPGTGLRVEDHSIADNQTAAAG